MQAPRDEPAVLVADLDLDQRRDWLALFPFLRRAAPTPTGRLSELRALLGAARARIDHHRPVGALTRVSAAVTREATTV